MCVCVRCIPSMLQLDSHRCWPEFLSTGPHQTEQLTLSLFWNAIPPSPSVILCKTSALPPDIHSNRCLILVDLPLNNKLTSLPTSELRPLPQNPKFGFLKVPLLWAPQCLCVVKNQGIESDFNTSMFQCSSFKYSTSVILNQGYRAPGGTLAVAAGVCRKIVE